MLMAPIIFPFHQPKKKKQPRLASPLDFSLSLDEVPAIYIFVCQEGGGKHINKAPANPTTLLGCEGTPSAQRQGCLAGS